MIRFYANHLKPIMDEAELNQVEKIVDELDAFIPKSGSLLLIQQEHKFPSYIITGNRLGLLRLGVESLRAGLILGDNKASWNPFESETFIDTDYLKADKGTYFLRQDSLQKVERDRSGKKVFTRKERFQRAIFSGIMGTFFYGFVALAIVGLITVARWIF